MKPAAICVQGETQGNQKGERMLEILGKTNIDFMGKRKFSFLFSGIMVLLGLVALIQIARGAANLGIDFAGGTAVQLKFEQPVKIDEARKALETSGLDDAELQEFGQDNKLLIRVKTSTTIEEKIAERVVGIFGKEFPNNKFVVGLNDRDRTGHRQEAARRCARGHCGVICGHYSLHRSTIRTTVRRCGGVGDIPRRSGRGRGVLHLGQRNYPLDRDGPLDAGWLFLDRYGRCVRSDQRESEVASSESEEATINSAINQVLSRTIVTSLTVVIVLIPLTLAGGEVLHDFSLALLGGVIFGTYSSVFVASPLLLLWPGASGRLLKRS